MKEVLEKAGVLDQSICISFEYFSYHIITYEISHFKITGLCLNALHNHIVDSDHTFVRSREEIPFSNKYSAMTKRF